MPSQKKKIMYVLEEDAYWNYLFRIESDRTVVSELLFGEGGQSIPDLTKSLLCEYFGILRHFENVLEDITDNSRFNKKINSYAVTETEGLQFSVFLENLVVIREELLAENCSILLH